MIISVASGKGGTGKTTVAVNLALSLENVQLIDCDVEEPNSGIFLNPEITDQKKAYIPVPEINSELCNFCGKCQDVCEYNAIAVMPASGDYPGKVLILNNLCHGCGACQFLCPQKAIKEFCREVGSIDIGEKEGVSFIQGKLNLCEAMAPPVIRQVKEYIDENATVIIDAPPGTSCPVIMSVQNTDFCILVTEPTPFGLNDLRLAVETLEALSIPYGVVINRSDIGDDKTEAYCERKSIPVLMKIPFSKDIAKAYSTGIPIVDVFPEYKNQFQSLYQKVKSLVEDRKSNERSFNY